MSCSSLQEGGYCGVKNHFHPEFAENRTVKPKKKAFTAFGVPFEIAKI
jgi:hypothetical protein